MILTLPPARAALPEDIQSRLNEIRRNLQVSIAAQERAAAELAALKRSGGATPEIIEDYELYLNRLNAMVAQNRKALGEMQALCDKYAAAAAPAGAGERTGAPPDKEIIDESVRLERQLDASLAAFDDMLLQEQETLSRKLEEIRAKTDARMESLEAEAEDAAGRLRDQGVELDSESASAGGGEDGETAGETGAEGESQAGAETSGADGEKSAEHGGEKDGTDGDEPGMAAEAKGTGGGQRPKSPPTADDDDIVARQLREAAEKETDPELKEKLWEEYEAYKRGQSRKSGP